VHKKCSGLKGRMKVDSDYQCTNCRVNGTTAILAASGRKDNLMVENGKSVECVVVCCYLGIYA
jgi:hypothetical protein